MAAQRKSISLTPQVRQVLQIDAQQLTPAELIRAILAAPSTCSGTAASAPM